MKKTFIKRGFFAYIATFLLVASSIAQTITTGVVTPASLCAGGEVSVAFTTASVPATAAYTLQISDASGAFTTPLVTATGTASPISVVIPAGTPAGAGYKARIISDTPALVGSESAVFTIMSISSDPAVVNKNYTVGDPVVGLELSVTGTGLLWYTDPTMGTGSATAPTISTAAAGTTSYYVSQTVAGSCESARVKIDVIVSTPACVPPAAPAVTNKNYTVGDAPVSLALSVTGTNLLWYTAATGGTGSATAPTISTAAAGTTSYWVTQSATVGSCESQRAQIDVIVTAAACVPPAAPAVTNKNYTVGDAPVSLALSVTGTNLLWYTAATGGTGSATAPTISTAAAGTTSYWVTQSATVGSCESQRAQIDVIVTAAACVPPAAPAVTNKNYTVGDAPVSLALSVTGTNLLWYTAATGGTGSATAPTISTAAAGTTSYWVTQSATVGSCESPRAQIDVIVTAAACVPPAAPAVTNKNYTVGDAPVSLGLSVTGTNLLWYTAATGGTGSATAPTISTATAGTTSYWVTQSATVGSCESPRAQIDVIVSAAACVPPAAPVVVNKNYTVGDAPVSLALSVTGTNLLWYTAASGGTGSATVPTISTAAAGTKSYWVTQSATVGSCESPRAQINVIVSAAACVPPAAPAVVNKSYTIGDAPVSLALSVTGNNLLWYTAATGGSGSATPPTISTATAGTKSYWVTQSASVGSCESPRAQINVIVSACTPPAAPTVTSPVNYTLGQATSVLSATGTGNFLWYTVSTGGSGTTTAPKPTSTSVGTTSYWVSQTVANCESARSKIDVVVSGCATAAPTVTSPASYSIGAPATALTATGTALKWYNVASGGNALPSAPTPSTAALGTTSYYVSQTLNGCEGPRAKIDVVITPCTTPAPAVISPVKYDVGAVAKALTATGTALKWYTTATGGTATSAPTPSTAATAIGNKSYFVSQTLNGCEGPRAEIVVTVTCATLAAVVVSPVTYCFGVTASALTATGSGLKWYSAATGGTAFASAPVPSTTNIGTTSYYVSQTVNGCEGPRTEIKVVVNKTEKPAVSTATVEYCMNAPTSALSATGTAIKWYTVATGGTALSGAPTPSTATVGDVTYYVSQTLNNCEGERASIKVTTKPLPAKPAVTPVSYCMNDGNVSPLSAAGSSLQWYGTSATGGTPSNTPNIPSTSATANYYVSQIVNGCEGPRASLLVTIKPLPAAPTIVTPVVYCQFIQATPLTATSTAPATLQWYGTDGSGGNPSDVAPTPSTENGGTTSFYVGQKLAGCFGSRAKIDVQVNTTPLPNVLTPAVAYCQNETPAPLAAEGNGLKWYLTIDDASPRTSPLVPYTLKVEDYSFYVTQTGAENKCESPKAEIKIHIKALPSALISGNSSIALGGTATVTLKFTGDGPWKYVLSNGTTDSTDQATKNIQVTPSTTTTYVVTQVSNSCGKGTPIGSAVVTVLVPTITSGNPTVSEVCAGKSFGVPFQQSGDFPSTNTFKVQISLTNDDTKFYTIPSVATSNMITATFPDSTIGGNYFIRVISTGPNPDFTVKGSVSAIGIEASPLPVATIMGTQTILIGDSGDLKVEITGKSPWSFNLNNGTKDSLITASSTPYSFKIAPRVTTTYTISSVTNVCGAGKGAGSARVQVDPILGVEPPVTDWVKVYPTLIEAQQCIVELTGSISPKEAKVQVLNMNGNTIHDQAIHEKTTGVDFTKYPSGLYLLRVQNGSLNSVIRVMKP